MASTLTFVLLVIYLAVFILTVRDFVIDLARYARAKAALEHEIPFYSKELQARREAGDAKFLEIMKTIEELKTAIPKKGAE